MTSERRAARATHHAQAVPEAAADADVLALLRNPDAPVWHDHDEFLALMKTHGWDAGCIGWFREVHPANRRNTAAEEWGAENGIGRDWHRLQAMGLIADTTSPAQGRGTTEGRR